MRFGSILANLLNITAMNPSSKQQSYLQLLYWFRLFKASCMSCGRQWLKKLQFKKSISIYILFSILMHDLKYLESFVCPPPPVCPFIWFGWPLLFRQPCAINNGRCLKLITTANKVVYNTSSSQNCHSRKVWQPIHYLHYSRHKLSLFVLGHRKAATKGCRKQKVANMQDLLLFAFFF